MFKNFRNFWNIFINAIKAARAGSASDKLTEPPTSAGQDWRDVTRRNLLNMFIVPLNNLTNNEATFEVVSDSNTTEKVKDLCKRIEDKRFQITAEMLAHGDYYIFPELSANGNLAHTYLSSDRVRILDVIDDEIKEAYAVIDWFEDNRNKQYYLVRHHLLDLKGDLYVEFTVLNENGKKATLSRWDYLDGKTIKFANANHIGFGRYKCPTDSRGYSPVYGVPLNFFCKPYEDAIFDDLELIDKEFGNASSKLFVNENIAKATPNKKTGKNEYTIAENVFVYKQRGVDSGQMIDIYNPEIRESAYYTKLDKDMGMYEQAIGTSKGILTENETSYQATATAVKRANSDTIALLGRIRNAVDAGNRMTLQADSVYLNIPFDSWEYNADWYDPFEDPSEQFDRLVTGKQEQAVPTSYLTKWLYPDKTDEQIQEMLTEISEQNAVAIDEAVERAMRGF